MLIPALRYAGVINEDKFSFYIESTGGAMIDFGSPNPKNVLGGNLQKAGSI